MDISVIILTYNEEDNIAGCLQSILRQKYPQGRWEVLVVDGSSRDNTAKIVSDRQEETGRLKLITNKKRAIAPGRNLGIRESRYPFIAFTDADCLVPEDWLERLSREYKNLALTDDKIVGVGGGNIPPADSSEFHQAVGIYLDSFLGCFNSPQGRNFSQVRKVNSLACVNVLYNKKILEETGGFDEGMGNIAEDSELNFRLTTNGYNLYFIPNVTVMHKLRPNLSSWLKNMALYGRGRAIISFKHKLFFTPFFILSLGFITGMILTPFGFINPIFFLPLLYFPVIGFYAGAITLKKGKALLFPETLIIFISTHFVYAFNLLFESLRICFRKTFGTVRLNGRDRIL